VEATLRNFAPLDPFVVRWQFPLFVRDNTLDPAELKVPGKTKRDKAAEQERRDGEHRDQLLRVLRSHADGETARTLRIEAGLNPATFNKAVAVLLQEGRAEMGKITKKGTAYDAFKPTGK
jgi:hypothetical protein